MKYAGIKFAAISLAAYAASFVPGGWWLALRALLLSQIVFLAWLLGYNECGARWRDGG